MTQPTNRDTEHTAPRRSGGFAWQLVYLLTVATIFNGAALGSVALASGHPAPVQVLIGVSLIIMLMAAFHVVVKGLAFLNTAPRPGTSRQTRVNLHVEDTRHTRRSARRAAVP